MSNKDKLIRDSKAVCQAIEFGGMQNGKIHFTDFDAVLEINDEFLFLTEIKRKGNELQTGQSLAYTRVIDAWSSTIKPETQWSPAKQRKGIFLFATHSFYDTNVDVPVEDCDVESIYVGGQWVERGDMPESMHNLKSAMNTIGLNWDIEKLRF